MAQRTALLLGGTKMVERHLRRALPADVDMIEMRTIEAAMRRLEDDSVAILVFGPTLRRSLALVTTLRSDPRTSRVPLVVVYRDDQRSDVDRHLAGRYKADAYVIQSRAQRELEAAIGAAMAAPRSDLGMPSELLDALPLAAVSALTQDITQFAQAAAGGQPAIETTLELDAFDLVEEAGDDSSDSATQMLDVSDFADMEEIEEIEPQADLEVVEPLEELGIGDLLGATAENLPQVDSVVTLGDLDVIEVELEELSDTGMRANAAPQANMMAILPEELPLEELDAKLLDVGEVDAIEISMVDDEEMLDIDDLVVESDELTDDDDSILEDFGDIEELDEIEPFEASTETDHETEVALADEIELLDEDLAALSAEPMELEAVALGGSSRASDIAIEALDITEMEADDDYDDLVATGAATMVEAVHVEAVDVEAVDVEAVDVEELGPTDELVEIDDVVEVAELAPAAVAPVVAAAAPTSASAPAPTAPAFATATQADTVAGESAEVETVVLPPQRQRHASSTELLSSNLSELTSLITKLQAALSDIDRLEGENAELRAELEAKSASAAPTTASDGAELEAARAELAKAQTSLQEAEQLGLEAMAANETAQAQIVALQAAQAAASAETGRERKAQQSELAAARDAVAGYQASAAAAKELLRKAIEQL